MATLYPTLPTWVTSAIVTKAQLDLMNQALTFLRNPPMCIVYHNANQAIANNTLTALALNSERVDPWAMHSTAVNNSRVTVPASGDGVYNISGHVGWAAGTAGRRLIGIYLNGTAIAQQEVPSASAAFSMSVARNGFPLVAGDYVEIQVLQVSGGSLNVDLGSGVTEFSVTWAGTGN